MMFIVEILAITHRGRGQSEDFYHSFTNGENAGK